MEFPELEIQISGKLKKEKLAFFSTFCLLISLLEFKVTWAELEGSILPSTFLLIHAMLSTAAIAFLCLYWIKKWDLRFSLLFAILLTSLGPMGAGMTMLIVGFYLLESKFFANGNSLMDVLNPHFENRKSTLIFNRITYGMEDTEIKPKSASYQDVMLFGTDKQKRSALEKIGRYFRPEFVPFLEMAMNDPNTTVRVHAGSTFSRLQTQFYNHYIKLEELQKSHPSDLNVLLAFAQHCEKYANSRLLTHDSEIKIRHLAIESYLKYLEAFPDQFASLLSLATLYYGLEDYEKGLHSIDEILKTNPLPPAIVYLIQMKTLFSLKRFSDLRQLSKRSLSFDLDDPDAEELKKLMLMWKEVDKDKVAIKRGQV